MDWVPSYQRWFLGVMSYSRSIAASRHTEAGSGQISRRCFVVGLESLDQDVGWQRLSLREGGSAVHQSPDLDPHFCGVRTVGQQRQRALACGGRPLSACEVDRSSWTFHGRPQGAKRSASAASRDPGDRHRDRKLPPFRPITRRSRMSASGSGHSSRAGWSAGRRRRRGHLSRTRPAT